MKKALLLLTLALIPVSLTHAAPKLTPEQKQKILKKFDKDGDGKLNAEERAAVKAALQARRAQRG